MIDGLIDKAQSHVTRAAKTALIGLIAGVFLALGLAFLTVAAWLLLTSVFSTLVSAAILGGGFFGVGLVICIMLKQRSKTRKFANDQESREKAAKQAATSESVAGLMTAFVSGIKAGRKMRSE